MCLTHANEQHPCFARPLRRTAKWFHPKELWSHLKSPSQVLPLLLSSGADVNQGLHECGVSALQVMIENFYNIWKPYSRQYLPAPSSFVNTLMTLKYLMMDSIRCSFLRLPTFPPHQLPQFVVSSIISSWTPKPLIDCCSYCKIFQLLVKYYHFAWLHWGRHNMRGSNILLKQIHAPAVADGWLVTWVGPAQMKLEKY